MEDACDWLSKMFEPLIAQLAPSSSVLLEGERSTLSQYLFRPYFVCGLDATDEFLRLYQVDTQPSTTFPTTTRCTNWVFT